jgi:hypothetical protein
MCLPVMAICKGFLLSVFSSQNWKHNARAKGGMGFLWIVLPAKLSLVMRNSAGPPGLPGGETLSMREGNLIVPTNALLLPVS